MEKNHKDKPGVYGKPRENPQKDLDPPGKKPGIKSQQGQPTVFSLSRGRRKATIQGLIPKIPPQAAIQRQILNNRQGSPSRFQALPAWNSHPKSQFQLQFSLPRFWVFFHLQRAQRIPAPPPYGILCLLGLMSGYFTPIWERKDSEYPTENFPWNNLRDFSTIFPVPKAAPEVG